MSGNRSNTFQSQQNTCLLAWHLTRRCSSAVRPVALATRWRASCVEENCRSTDATRFLRSSKAIADYRFPYHSQLLVYCVASPCPRVSLDVNNGYRKQGKAASSLRENHSRRSQRRGKMLVGLRLRCLFPSNSSAPSCHLTPPPPPRHPHFKTVLSVNTST
jgi:hypothetical protein